MSREPKDERREHYRHFLIIPTRWIDNDIYAHINNAVYYTYFDTVINQYLMEVGGLDPVNSDSIGLAVETFCKFLAPISFPDVLDAGLRISKLGNSSVVYEVGIFKQGEETPCAIGHFVHVFVTQDTRRPTPIMGQLRDAMEDLLVADDLPN